MTTLTLPGACLQGVVTSEQAAAALAEPELQASDLVPRKYEGEHDGSSSSSRNSTPSNTWSTVVLGVPA